MSGVLLMICHNEKRLHVLGICRGQGVAYISLLLKNTRKNQQFCFKSSSESGVDLPVETYRTDVNEHGSVRYVVVLPLLETTTVAIEVAELDSTGQPVLVGRRVFPRSFIKWASRFNYRFHHDRALSMRDIDLSTYADQIHLSPKALISAPQKGELILKGQICLPSEDFASLRVIDGNGMAVDCPSLRVGNPADVTVMGRLRREVPFTVRVPDDGKTYCVVADSQKGNRSGFLCLDPAARAHYLATLSPSMYRCAGGPEYKNRTIARGRFLSGINREEFSDYVGPKFSVIVPLYRTPAKFLNDMVGSVIDQVYQNWELILLNASPEDATLQDALTKIADSRVRVIELEGNNGISDNTNVGIEAASGDYVVFFDHDDLLDPLALYYYAEAINEDGSIDVLYCDEDFLNEEGEFVAPHFKSDFNLDLLRCHNYITHLLAVRAAFAKELMLRSAFDGAQDYDFLLRLVERTQQIVHIPDVLYHWRISDTSTAKSAGNKGYANDAGRRALQEHLDRCGIAATAELTDNACFYHVTYEVVGDPLVSILIPNKDSVKVLKRCIDSVEGLTRYRNFEIIIIENNSVEKETFAYYEQAAAQYDNIRVVTWQGEFNYSAINNFGARDAQGDFILLLNNDVEVIEPKWLESMLAICQRPEVGVVGAKLLYPDDTVQHAGVIMVKCQSIAEEASPGHAFWNLDRDDPGYMRRASLVQDLSAVTGACLMTKKSIFDGLGGLNEEFVVAFNDVDYCLRVRELDKLVVYTPDALLYHHESFSRGSDAVGKNMMRFIGEQGKLRSAWSKYYACGDPYHRPAATMGYYPEVPLLK